MKALTKDRAERYDPVLEFARDFAEAAAPQVKLREDARDELPPTEIVVLGGPVPAEGRIEQPQDKGTTSVPVHMIPPSSPQMDRIEPPRGEPPPAEKSLRVSPVGSAIAKGPKSAEGAWRQGWAKYVLIRICVLAVVSLAVWHFSRLGPAQVEGRLNPKGGLKYVWIPPGEFHDGLLAGGRRVRRFGKAIAPNDYHQGFLDGANTRYGRCLQALCSGDGTVYAAGAGLCRAGA
jgi:hypothetical protein